MNKCCPLSARADNKEQLDLHAAPVLETQYSVLLRRPKKRIRSTPKSLCLAGCYPDNVRRLDHINPRGIHISSLADGLSASSVAATSIVKAAFCER
jgi:hypothetical protein